VTGLSAEESLIADNRVTADLPNITNIQSQLQNFQALRPIGDVVGGRMDSACLMLRAAATFWRVWERAGVLPGVAI
jgi:hypothetical protein